MLDPVIGEIVKRINKRAREQPLVKSGYKAKCSHCGAFVIAEQLAENGCFICGWRPKG